MRVGVFAGRVVLRISFAFSVDIWWWWWCVRARARVCVFVCWSQVTAYCFGAEDDAQAFVDTNSLRGGVRLGHVTSSLGALLTAIVM